MSDHAEVFREDGFGRKVGPLPIWGWAIVLAAVAFIYVRFVAGRSSSSSTASTAATGVPNVMTTGGYLPYPSSDGSTGSGATSYTDNTSWENAAVQGASQWGSDPLTVQQALDQYLKGSAGSVSQAQESLINRIINGIGAAPLGTDGTPTIAGSTPPPTTSSHGNFLSYIRSPNGSLAALFDNGTISEYGNMQQFNAAQKSTPGAVNAVTASQYAGYSKVASNYQGS